MKALNGVVESGKARYIGASSMANAGVSDVAEYRQGKRLVGFDQKETFRVNVIGVLNRTIGTNSSPSKITII